MTETFYHKTFYHFNHIDVIFDHRTLQAEYDRLRTQQEHNNNEKTLQAAEDDFTNHDEEMLAEAKLLRQHKGRLEARMRILEDHNRQLEAQLQRLRHLLEQVRLLYLIQLEGKNRVHQRKQIEVKHHIKIVSYKGILVELCGPHTLNCSFLSDVCSK